MASQASKGKGIENSTSQNVEQLSREFSNVSSDAQEDGWCVYEKKSRSKGSASVNQWGQWGSSNPQSRGRGYSQPRPSTTEYNQAMDNRYGGRGNSKLPLPNNARVVGQRTPPPVTSGPLANGWQWGEKSRSSGMDVKKEEPIPEHHDGAEEDDEERDDDNDDFNSDGDLSEDYDSDASQKSFETRKKKRWFKCFFETLDKLTVEEITSPVRQWHCPACQNGPGAIDWYKGLQPLVAHAKTKGSTRIKIHRELAALLEEELSRRGSSVVPAGEQYGQWEGLSETTTDREIVWPPMVIVMNTQLDKDEDDKWIGMGNTELVEYFSTYHPAKARHSYGPQGHRGMSVLIFETSATGYMDAERLSKHFEDNGSGKIAWDRCRIPTLRGGKRQLYGYLATKEEMEIFNQHSHGKSRLKYEMRSYHEMVVHPMKKMSEEVQQMHWLKNKVFKEQRKSKALEETFEVVSQKLRETMEENKIVRLRTKIQHEENKEEMDYQERFFKEQIDRVHKATEEKERLFEKTLQEERAKAKEANLVSGTKEDRRLRKEAVDSFIDSQMKGVKEFEEEREVLLQLHDDKKAALRREYLQKEVELEEQFDADLTALMDKYRPRKFGTSDPCK